MIDAQRMIEAVETKHSEPYEQTLLNLLLAELAGDRTAAFKARTRLAEIMSNAMSVGEIIGAQSMLRTAAQAYADEFGARLRADLSRCMRFAEEPSLPNVTLSEAVAELLSRTPTTLRNAAQRTAAKVAELYSKGRVLAFVRAASEKVTWLASDLIRKGMAEGIAEGSLAAMIRKGVGKLGEGAKGWTQAYARMAFRTNMNTAVSAGRFRQSQDPDVRAVVPAFRFDAVGDSDTRDQHMLMDGRILRVDNPAWARLAPPLGYNCRCQISLLSLPMLRRMGRVGKNGQIIEDRVPPNAGPDAGFRHGGRPDLAMVGV